MSLMLIHEAETLAAKIRTRMAEGAAVQEVAVVDMPAWLAAEVEGQAVAAAFISEHAGVAVLDGGRTVVRRAPKH
jgi:hypothetical protein